MGDVIFACDKNNYQARQSEFRGPKRQEYYEGDYQISPGDDVEVRIEKGIECSTFSILNLRTRTDLLFKRSWSHIQRDKTDVTSVWFVKRGRVAVSENGETTTIDPGECAITRSLQPFHMEILVDDQSVNEVLHVVAPTQVLRSYIPDAVRSGAAFSFRHGNCCAAERTFMMLYEEGTRVDRDVAEELMRAALVAVGHGMSRSLNPMPPRTLGERRLNDILTYIEKQLSNPDLTASAVASGCGISTRYLCSILKSHDKCFSEVLWNSRLDKTKTWLTNENMCHLPVGKIGYMAGFKSAAHFSRTFKRTTNMTPGDFRAAQLHHGLAFRTRRPSSGDLQKR
jgi:AraC family transcriptional activator of tynA and feaB